MALSGDLEVTQKQKTKTPIYLFLCINI